MECKEKATFRVLIVEPSYKPPYTTDPEMELEELQALVVMNIQFRRLDCNTVLYCNADGKLLELPGSRLKIYAALLSGHFSARMNFSGRF